MIHSISANMDTFHTVNFEAGLNVILAERAEGSSAKDTRNGLGKSTLIDIIDFCLGSNPTRGKGLLIEPLDNWAFTLDITLGDNRVQITRAIATPNSIFIIGPTAGWPDQPTISDDIDRPHYNADQWRSLLGKLLFGLPSFPNQLKYKPSYRSLISYFARHRPDAYISPFRHFRQQNTWNIQTNTAYLLGMNWEFASDWQVLRDKDDGIKAIKKAFKTGALDGAVGTVGELETQRIQLEQQTSQAKEALDTFRVHPQYESIQSDADRMTSEIHNLVNRNVLDQRKLTLYLTSISDEQPPSSSSLELVYEESGVHFPDAVRRSLDEARQFHGAILTNREDFLQAEIQRIQDTISQRESEVKEVTNERAGVMEILQSHGALQEMTKLQERHLALQSELSLVDTRLEEIRDLTVNSREVKAARADLARAAAQDHADRREVWSEPVRLFNEHSQALYKSPGTLIIDVTESGYKFNVEIERSGSEGIDKMKVFCYDLALLQLQMESGNGIDFLIHDTLMYDSVDARQRALAFERAHHTALALDGQYICTINSDMIPVNEFSDDFNFQEHVRLTLNDAAPSGSLLGIRFERP